MTIDDNKKAIIKKALPPGRVFFDFDRYFDYTRDAAEIVHKPDALFFAESEEEIATAVRACNRLELPLIMRGAGTGYSGGAVAAEGGLVLSIERLDSIDIDPDGKTAIVGPGAITADIMKAAEKHGLFYPPDPASFEESTIAGNLAENAGGLRCKKYGVTKDYVKAVRGIDAAGDIMEIDQLSPYGLMDVIIGSEGTLFIFTSITLRLIDIPRPGPTILSTFEKAVHAASVVSEVTASGIVPLIMEFMDGDAIACSNQYDPEHRIEPAAAMLLFETDGPGADKDAESIMDICRRHLPQILRMAENSTERELLWKTRRNLSNAVKETARTKTAEDVCVPPSRLPELVAYVEELSRILSVRVNSYGHAGDGNLHVNFLGLTGGKDEIREIDRGVSLLFDKTLELNGTLSGEHGIGITKKDFLNREFDSPTMRFMKRLKRCLDPDNRLNPGKIF